MQQDEFKFLSQYLFKPENQGHGLQLFLQIKNGPFIQNSKDKLICDGLIFLSNPKGNLYNENCTQISI